MLRVLGWLGVLAGLILLPVAGIVVPRALIGDGLDRFEGEKRAMAEDALRSATGDIFDGETPAALIISKIRVTDVSITKRCPSLEAEARACGGRCGEEPALDDLRDELSGDGDLSAEDRKTIEENRINDRVQGRFTAELMSHTFFGIPLRKLNTSCEGELREL